MKVVKYEKVESKGALKAFFSVEIPEWKLTVDRMCEFNKGTSRWIGMPSYSEEINGKRIYHPYVEFDGDNQGKFICAAKKALDDFLSQNNSN